MTKGFKQMTNAEWFERALTCSKGGPLVNAICVEALSLYLKAVLGAPRPPDNGASFVNPTAWWDACDALADEFEEKYGPIERGSKRGA